MGTKEKTTSGSWYQIIYGNGEKQLYRAENYTSACVFAHDTAAEKKTIALSVKEVSKPNK